MAKTILITGATGNVSSGILERLKGSGHNLRALVRNPDKADALRKQGIDARIGDLEKPWTLAPAFEGADSVWLLAPPGPRAPEQSSNGLWAARQAGVRHIVRMSAVNAAYNAPTINSRLHALSDAEVAASGIPYTILKPHFFAQNLIATSAGSIAREGAIYAAMGEARIGIIDSRDISEFAAHVLTHTGHEGKTYTLTGPASLNMHQIAEAVGNGIGKPVKYVPIPLEAAQQAMAGMGMDPWLVNFLADYLKAYASGWGDLANGEFQAVTGKAPRSVEQFARDFAGAFGKR
jgi:uncharacterized protein YbjT (DUF2867 family)